MSTANQIIARMQQQLQLSDPSWDVTVGTPEYKILEAVASEIATASNNSVLQSYSFDINTKSGSALDAYVALFGMYRLTGYRATGTATFQTQGAASANYDIPMGTQVYVPPQSSNSIGAVYFQSLAPAIILQGESTVEIPIEATQPGSSGNVPANSITSITTGLTGITGITNTSPTSGGTDPETDIQLRARWSATVFRNLAGTVDQFTAVALNTQNVSLVNVVGPQVLYEEQDQISDGSVTWQLSGGSEAFTLQWNGINSASIADNASASTIQSDLITAFQSSGFPTITVTGGPLPTVCNITIHSTQNLTLFIGNQTLTKDFFTNPTITSQVTDASYVYPEGGELIGVDLGTSSQFTMTPSVDYTYSPSLGGNPPIVITVDNGSQNPLFDVDQIVDFQYQYTPLCSRNTPGTNPPITNKVDIFVNGAVAQEVTEESVFNTATTFVSSSPTGTEVLNTNYLMLDQVTHPSVGDIFTQLFQQPYTPSLFPTSIDVGATTYFMGMTRTEEINGNPISYYPLIDNTKTNGSPLDISGIAWVSGSSPALPINGTLVILEYYFNNLISDLNDLMQQVRLVGSDVLVHQAQYVQIQINLVIVYGQDQNPASVNSSITTALENYFQTQQYLGAIRAADVIQTVMGVAGVTNVRMALNDSSARTPDSTVNWGLQTIAQNGSILANYPPINTIYPSDIYLANNQLPQLYGVNFYTRSQNTF